MQTIQQEKGFSLSGAANRRVTYSADVPHQATSDGWLLSSSGISLHYRGNVQVDRFPYVAPEPIILQPTKLDVLPGFDVTRLAFPQEIMPTALAWKPDRTLVFSSLKGRVWMAQDRNGDTLEETLWPATDELAAPFGLHAETDYVDVINKYALLRMTDLDRDGRFDRYVTLASGWGHTTDYHDWAIGLPRDEQGRYYVAFACQQDVRSEVQARFRGTVTRLTPKAPTHEDPHRYAIETISAGHRFPIGMARSRNGELFVTDNQGNYNPFNELNHVRFGKRYGFYNALEKTQGTQFPTEPPAIKIPHPWTRSVNGICFLESDKPGLFGPFRGDLIGCEMNERQLIRMSLEKVDGVFQGAAYPFTQRVTNANQGLLGPLSCAISPRGDLYLGCLLDSGWGGGNNIGSIVQCRPRPHGHSPGIDEIRITPVGFEIRFNSAINATRAAKLEHYSVTSFTRVSTPAYGGDDHNRKVETVQSVRLAADRKRVFLEFANQPRPDYVYEFHLRNLAEKGQEFFPDEAYYTVLKVPQENDD